MWSSRAAAEADAATSASPRRRARTPRFAETGLPGEEASFDLRLKLLADAALVGLPNAGKSSLLTRISNARPKVADYPFTTLAPVLGTVDSPDGSRQLTVADVPGLIEGASEGVGLGHEFLAHLERANLLLHVIDSADGDTAERFAAIDHELEAYGAGLESRSQAIVLNKIDLLPEPPEFDVHDDRIVSACSGSRARRVRASRSSAARCSSSVRRRLRRPCRRTDSSTSSSTGRGRAAAATAILRTDRGFRIAGEAPTDEDELEAALKAAGARSGDEVEIGDEVLELQ